MVDLARVELRLSVEKVEILRSGLHGVDQKFVAAVETKHDDFEQTPGRLEAEAKLTRRIVLVQLADEDGMLGGMDSVIGIDTVLAGRMVNFHAT